MVEQLKLAKVFAAEAKELLKARASARLVHSSDIRAAGNEIEEAVRGYLKRMLPPRYYVTHGHLIDAEHIVSPQLDVIIADNFSLPSLLTTKDGTEYVPVTSVMAIGEVKSTYYHGKNYYEHFLDVLTKISNMHRPLVENTAYGGFSPSTTIRDMTLGSTNRYLNNLFSFLLCIDGGNFDFEKTRSLLTSTSADQLPSIAVFLNQGIVGYSKRTQPGTFNKYPNQVDSKDYDWIYVETVAPEEGSVEGANLALLYGQLVSHLSNSHLDPPNAYKYIADTVKFLKSSLMWADQS